MKTNDLAMTVVKIDPAIESYIHKQDADLRDLATANAKHFASRNQPSVCGDNLAAFVGEIKTGYEKLAARVFTMLQPNANIPEAKIEAEYYKDKDTSLEKQINEKRTLNQHATYELGNTNTAHVFSRIRIAIIATFITTLGEIIFNAKAFQVTDENTLFSFILSLSVSFGVFIFSHVVTFLYKEAKTKLHRVLIVVGALALVTVLFISLAIFRSQYLATRDVHIKPVYFVIINLFFFIVSSLFSFFVLPTWQQLRASSRHLKIHADIAKRTREIKALEQEREQIKRTFTKNTQLRMRYITCANYCADLIRKMCAETIELYKRTNLAYRADMKTPDCYGEPIEANIQDASFNFLTLNRKSS